MSYKDFLEAQFKTLDEENPIDVVAEDIVLELQKEARKYNGDDVIACFDGFEDDKEDPSMFTAKFSIRMKKDGKWDCTTIIEAYCEWAKKPGAIFHVWEIEEH
jgi:hypothetical protein